MAEDKRTKVKKGYLVVRVGLEEDDSGFQRFVIPISYLHHPLFRKLLETAQEVYGFHSSGPLKLPCSTDDFLHLQWFIKRESHHSHGYHHQSSISLSSCGRCKRKDRSKLDIKLFPWCSSSHSEMNVSLFQSLEASFGKRSTVLFQLLLRPWL